MKSWRTGFVLGLTALVALAFVAQARADIYMKQKTHTGALTVMGQTQPEKDEIMVYWIGAGKARTDTEAKKMAQMMKGMAQGMMKSQAEAWASEDLKIDDNVYFTMANAMMASQPGFDKLVQEMKKVKGVIVYQTSKAKVMGQDMTSTVEVLEYTEKGAPAGTYDIPAGYKKVKASRGM